MADHKGVGLRIRKVMREALIKGAAGGGGGDVTSVFTRTGAVTADSGDYISFYSSTGHEQDGRSVRSCRRLYFILLSDGAC